MEQIEQITNETLAFFLPFIPDLLKEEFDYHTGLLFYGIMQEDVACGTVILERDGRDIRLRYLYLAEDYRGTGIADRMMTDLLYLLWKQGYETMSARYCPKSSPQLHRCLRAKKFRLETEGYGTFQFTLKELGNADTLKGSFPHVVSLAELPNQRIKQFCHLISAEGKDLIPMPIEQSDYLSDCCAVYMENGNPTGILLLQQNGEKNLKIPFLYSTSSHPTALVEMIRFLYAKGSLAFQEDTVCVFYSIHNTLTTLIERIIGISADRQVIARLELSCFANYEDQIQALLL